MEGGLEASGAFLETAAEDDFTGFYLWELQVAVIHTSYSKNHQDHVDRELD